MHLGNETVKTVNIDGKDVDVIGCWDSDTPKNDFDFYDLYVEGQCINEGEPCYELPDEQTIRAQLEIWKEMGQ